MNFERTGGLSGGKYLIDPEALRAAAPSADELQVLLNSVGAKKTPLTPDHLLTDEELSKCLFAYAKSHTNVRFDAREAKKLSAKDLRLIYRKLVIAESLGED